MRPKIDWLDLDVCGQWDHATRTAARTHNEMGAMDEHGLSRAAMLGDNETFGIGGDFDSLPDLLDDATHIRFAHRRRRT